MRLWHYKLIPFLPNSQLIAQWRELNSIYKNQPKHILINYVYRYEKDDLLVYSLKVTKELEHRGINIKKFDNFVNYFKGYTYRKYIKSEAPFIFHHNERYLRQCFYNLQEKFDRGQKDFSKEQYRKLLQFAMAEKIIA